MPKLARIRLCPKQAQRPPPEGQPPAAPRLGPERGHPLEIGGLLAELARTEPVPIPVDERLFVARARLAEIVRAWRPL